MSEHVLGVIYKIAGGLFFVGCMYLVISGQKSVSYSSLLMMLCGLCGILILLYLYNRSWTKESHHADSGNDQSKR